VVDAVTGVDVGKLLQSQPPQLLVHPKSAMLNVFYIHAFHTQHVESQRSKQLTWVAFTVMSNVALLPPVRSNSTPRTSDAGKNIAGLPTYARPAASGNSQPGCALTCVETARSPVVQRGTRQQAFINPAESAMGTAGHEFRDVLVIEVVRRIPTQQEEKVDFRSAASRGHHTPTQNGKA